MPRSALLAAPFYLLATLPAQHQGYSDASAALAPFQRTGGGLGGAAWLDFDRDGALDLFVPSGVGGPSALFRNTGNGAFTDVAAAAGLAGIAGCSGAVAGDVDGDGFPDLFVTGDGGLFTGSQPPNRLYRNNGDGTFTDVSAASGIPSTPSSCSAALGDLDGDGDLDLFVCSSGSRATKQQHQNLLLRNDGGGSFTDVSTAAGVDTAKGACAVALFDYDQDRDLDICVAVCSDVWLRVTPFELFRNDGGMTFTDVAASAGLTRAGFWMSVTPGDIDNDGDLDLFSTNSGTSGMNKEHGLWRNNGDGTFAEVTQSSGLTNTEFGWGASFLDADNDGDLDLFWAGSLPLSPYSIIGPGVGNPGLLFYNQGDGTFAQVAGTQPRNLSSLYTSGVSQADYDGDGFADLLVVTGRSAEGRGQPVLLRNRGGSNHWLAVDAAVGARIELTATVFGRPLRQVREVRAGSSFLCSETPWPTFGLGDQAGPVDVLVHWPSGRSERFLGLPADARATLVEGRGQAEPSYVPFGQGCAGAAGTPRLASAQQGPRLGQLFAASVTGVPAGGAAVLALGGSRHTWNGVPLPLSLAIVGASPACMLQASGESLVPLAASAGAATWSVPVPGAAALLGAAFYNQGLVLDAGAPGGLTVSNPAVGWVGR